MNFFLFVIFVFYILVPILIYSFIVPDALYLKTSALAFITIIGMAIGSKIPLISLYGRELNIVIARKKNTINFVVFLFLIFLFITLVTAESIPILSAFQGASAAILSDERGAFFKGRDGGWIILLYISSVFLSSIMPYVIISALEIKYRFRYVITGIFFIFSLLFLVKALFLNLLIPYISYQLETNPKQVSRILTLAFGSLVIMLIMISLSGYGSLEDNKTYNLTDYFSTRYIPTGILDFLIYRVFSVPIFSVVDTLHVHSTELNGKFLLGSTSSLLASILGVEKINIERIVFAYQYGGWNPIANSNVVFFVDGYINFGWFGVFIFGVIIGRIFKIISSSNNIAIKSLSLLFAMQLFSSPFIQMLLSNGWILIIVIALNSKQYKTKRTHNYGNTSPVY